MTNRIIVGMFIAILFSSCASMRQKRIDRICQICPEREKTDSVYIEKVSYVDRLDTSKTESDSSFYFAWLKCQDGSIPKIVKERSVKGKRTDITMSIDSVGKLTSKCNSDSLEQVIKGKDKIIDRLSTKITTKTIVINLKWWQRVLIWFGGFSLVYFALRFAFRFFERKMNGI